MKELVYCSQCHHSVYKYISSGVVVKKELRGNDKYLRCLKLGKSMACDAKIDGCVELLPEDVNKLRAGVWKANGFQSKSRKRKANKRKVAKEN